MKKILLLVVIVAAAYYGMQFLGDSEETKSLMAAAKEYCMNEHVERVEVSANAIKTVTSLPGGGSIYFDAAGASTVCPVVGPDAVSAECAAMEAITDWTVVCPTE